jgi:hypothetical protein
VSVVCCELLFKLEAFTTELAICDGGSAGCDAPFLMVPDSILGGGRVVAFSVGAGAGADANVGVGFGSVRVGLVWERVRAATGPSSLVCSTYRRLEIRWWRRECMPIFLAWEARRGRAIVRLI